MISTTPDPLAISITFLFLALATVFLLIRCDIRYRIQKNHGPEDALVLSAWLLAVAEQILLCVSIRHYEDTNPQQVTYLKAGT
ncbi:hypothetical protein E2P81_ATG02873 [Venturia nashicola]|nr:hypothetical protein E2P81_ATG02873 [Venturia nashicola]